MGNWGISKDVTPKEKLKSKMADFLNGLNCVGEINISTCDEIFDFSMDLLDEVFDLAKSEVRNEEDVAKYRYEAQAMEIRELKKQHEEDKEIIKKMAERINVFEERYFEG